METRKKESKVDKLRKRALHRFFQAVDEKQKKSGISDTALATDIGIHPSLFSHYKAGRRLNPAYLTIRKMEDATGLCARDFE